MAAGALQQQKGHSHVLNQLLVMPDRRFTIAAGQMTAGDDLRANLDTCRRLAADAASAGAKILCLPENFAFLGRAMTDRNAIAEALGDGGAIQSAIADAAKEFGLWVFAGGMPERRAGDEPVAQTYNTHLVASPDGEIVASYRKIHLFDIDIPGKASFKESAVTYAGSDAVVVETPYAAVGLSICYDLRFPELYRALVARGAQILLVPAAFTAHTGAAHWHTLLRARAIENECYVVAAAQTGQHNEKRHSYGHTLIVDPWGVVAAELADGTGIVTAEVDLEFLDKCRRELPCLDHRRI